MPGDESEGSAVWEDKLTLPPCTSAALLSHVCWQTESHSSSNIPLMGLVQRLAVTVWDLGKEAFQSRLYHLIPKRPLTPSGA